MRLEARHHVVRQIAVRRQLLALLPRAQRLAGAGADHAIGGTGVEADAGQGDLSRHAVGQRQRRLDRPGRDQRAAAGEAVGQQADAQGVGRRVVIGADREVVRQGQEGRSGRTRRQDQHGRLGGVGGAPGQAVGAAHALGLPPGRKLSWPLGDRIVEALRQDHFLGPAHAALPAAPVQQVGGRGQGIGVRAPDVALAVAVEVDGRGAVAGRDELGLAHGAGPGALQLGAGDLARIDDLEGRDQFALGPGASAAVGGEADHRADDVEIALQLAERRFHGPDGQQDVARHAIARLDRRQPGQLLALGPADGDPIIADHTVDIGAHRLGEFRLAAVQADDRRIGRDARQFAIQKLRRQAGGQGADAEILQPCVEGQLAVGYGRVRRRGRRSGCLRPGRGRRRRADGGQRPLRGGVRTAGEQENEEDATIDGHAREATGVRVKASITSAPDRLSSPTRRAKSL